MAKDLEFTGIEPEPSAVLTEVDGDATYFSFMEFSATGRAVEV